MRRPRLVLHPAQPHQRAQGILRVPPRVRCRRYLSPHVFSPRTWLGVALHTEEIARIHPSNRWKTPSSSSSCKVAASGVRNASYMAHLYHPDDGGVLGALAPRHPARCKRPCCVRAIDTAPCTQAVNLLFIAALPAQTSSTSATVGHSLHTLLIAVQRSACWSEPVTFPL